MDDVPAVLALFSQASAWLRSRGSDQWQYSPSAERTAANTAAGALWIAEQDHQPIATITVDDHADPEFWPTDDDPADALHVHRVIVARAAAGQGLGAALLDWASERAAAAGRKWIRLDAWSTNEQLHRYYHDRGWQHVRTLVLTHRGSGALFQRPAGSRTGFGPPIITVDDGERAYRARYG